MVQVVAVQSLTSSVQVAPSQPEAHAQDVRPVPTPFSVHVPLFAQVLAVQSTWSVQTAGSPDTAALAQS